MLGKGDCDMQGTDWGEAGKNKNPCLTIQTPRVKRYKSFVNCVAVPSGREAVLLEVTFLKSRPWPNIYSNMAPNLLNSFLVLSC